MYSKFKTIKNTKISLLSFCLAIVLLLSTVGCSKGDEQGNSSDGDNFIGDANQNIDIGEKDWSQLLAFGSEYLNNPSSKVYFLKMTIGKNYIQ